jgi:hypothetical protein
VQFSKEVQFKSHSVKSHFSKLQSVKVLGKEDDVNFWFLYFVGWSIDVGLGILGVIYGFWVEIQIEKLWILNKV